MKSAASTSQRARWVWLLMGAASLGAVAGALYGQHKLGMQPCPWCILQRLIFIVIGVACWLAAAWPAVLARSPLGRLARVGNAVLVTLLSLAGVATALYQNLVASKSPSCNLTLADQIVSGLGLDARWPEVFEVRASCADAAVDLLGVPFELWSLALFVVLAGAAIWQIRGHSGKNKYGF